MGNSITNFELGKRQHREYEAQASRYWGQNVTKDDIPILSKGYRILLALIATGLMTFLLVLMLVF